MQSLLCVLAWQKWLLSFKFFTWNCNFPLYISLFINLFPLYPTHIKYFFLHYLFPLICNWKTCAFSYEWRGGIFLTTWYIMKRIFISTCQVMVINGIIWFYHGWYLSIDIELEISFMHVTTPCFSYYTSFVIFLVIYIFPFHAFPCSYVQKKDNYFYIVAF